MKKIQVVIGANYGDEGKGLMTDYLAAKAVNKSIVVRFNGGAQAGHTVVTPNEIKHVFGHFGSGTLVGTPTFLSKDFIVNPLLFEKEFKELQSKGFSPKIFIDENCIMTTPWDMMINQIIESSITKHGSCGVGINETIKRCSKPEFKTTVSSHLSLGGLKLGGLLSLFNTIQNNYVHDRLKELGVKEISLDFAKYITSIEIVNKYLESLQFMYDNSNIVCDFNLDAYDNIIFESAQGLLLDQNNLADFPHLTPSNTGLDNVLHCIGDYGVDARERDFEVYYMSRKYLTRHGNGPLPTEENEELYTTDKTNVENQFQGKIRYGLLNKDTLIDRISKDRRKIPSIFKSTEEYLVFTHMDEPYPMGFIVNNKTVGYSEQEDLEVALRSNLFSLKVRYSKGPTRSDVY